MSWPSGIVAVEDLTAQGSNRGLLKNSKAACVLHVELLASEAGEGILR